MPRGNSDRHICLGLKSLDFNQGLFHYLIPKIILRSYTVELYTFYVDITSFLPRLVTKQNVGGIILQGVILCYF